jgi:hypothetical protein
MGKRKKKDRGSTAIVAERPKEQTSMATAAAPADAEVITAPELLRRLLLGGVTMLVVARPLVLGEDPGLLDRVNSNPAGLLLTLLWLLLATGWAGWRLWTRQRTWFGSAVEGSLLAVVGLVFFSAFRAASYRQPALLFAWEWLALLIVFCLVRQLASTPGDTRRMLAAVVATGVSIAAVAIYQHFLTLPAQHATIRPDEGSKVVAILPNGQKYDPTKLREMLKEGGISAPEDSRLEGYAERILMDHAFGTFAHPNALAGYLVLLLPAAAGWTFASWRTNRPHWQTIGAGLATLVLAAGLWYTHSKGAMLGLALVAGGAAFVLAWRAGVSRKALLGAAGGLVVVAAVVFSMRDRLETSFGQRFEYWGTTWKMIRDPENGRFFWQGVGPGNFRTFYFRYMSPTAAEEITDPHNFALELWATSGVLALLVFLVTMGFYFRYAWQGCVAAETGEAAEPPSRDGSRIHWEFYLGGMAGLSLAFFIWALGLAGPGAAENVKEGAITAGLRSIIWFAAFAIFEGIAWAGPTRTLALAAGVAALLVNLSVSGGIAWPSVAQPMWIVMALTLNGLVSPLPVWNIRYAFISMLAAPVLGIVALLYLLLGMHPALACQRSMNQAAERYPGYEDLQKKLAAAAPEDKVRVQRAIRNYLRAYIQKPLETAANANATDVEPALALARWYGELWQLGYELEGKDSSPLRNEALGQADRATRLDPQSARGYIALYDLNMRYARLADSEKREALLAKAAKQLKQASDCEPTRAELRFLRAELLYDTGERVEAYRQAERALKLDEQAPRLMRKLTDAQRHKLRTMLEDR